MQAQFSLFADIQNKLRRARYVLYYVRYKKLERVSPERRMTEKCSLVRSYVKNLVFPPANVCHKFVAVFVEKLKYVVDVFLTELACCQEEHDCSF